jgi:hypothetical protein
MTSSGESYFQQVITIICHPVNLTSSCLWHHPVNLTSSRWLPLWCHPVNLTSSRWLPLW